MTGRFLTGLALCGLLLGGTAQAADSAGKFAVKGAGVTLCGHFTQQVEEKKPEFYAYAGWIEGYLTAINGYQRETFDIAPWQNTKLLALMLAQHCRKNPEESFAIAVRRMTQALFPQRLANQSELVVARNGDQGIRLYKAIVERVQLSLQDRGLFNGEPNGNYDTATRDAVLAFQEKEKLAQSGLPDAATLLKLFNSQP